VGRALWGVEGAGRERAGWIFLDGGCGLGGQGGRWRFIEIQVLGGEGGSLVGQV